MVTPKLRKNTKKSSSAPCAVVACLPEPFVAADLEMSESEDAQRVSQRNLRHVPPLSRLDPEPPKRPLSPVLLTLKMLS